MIRTTTRGAVGGLLLALCGYAPNLVWGHAVMTAPTPRDNSDSHKDPNGPCGRVAPSDKNPAPYTAGQALTVEFTETVKHPGCFLISLSQANDQGFVLLGKVAHNSAPAPAKFRTTVTLPADKICEGCTLQLRQIMMNNEPATLNDCPPLLPAAYTSYYSCADLHIRAAASGDMATPPSDMAAPAAVDLATSPPPPPADLSAPPSPPSQPGGGCQLSRVALPWSPWALAPLLLVLAPLLRRRRAPARR